MPGAKHRGDASSSKGESSTNPSATKRDKTKDKTDQKDDASKKGEHKGKARQEQPNQERSTKEDTTPDSPGKSPSEHTASSDGGDNTALELASTVDVQSSSQRATSPERDSAEPPNLAFQVGSRRQQASQRHYYRRRGRSNPQRDEIIVGSAPVRVWVGMRWSDMRFWRGGANSRGRSRRDA